MDAAQEALAGKGPLGSERMTGLQELPSPASSTIALGREREHFTTARTDRLLEVTLPGSGKSRETGQGLIATAGDVFSVSTVVLQQP